VATMLTTGRRCSRRRLGVGGGATSVFTAASAPGRLLRGHERRLPRPAPRVPVKPQQRRAGGGAVHLLPPPLLLFLYSPLLLPYRRRGSGKGAKPQRGLVAVDYQLSASPLLLNPGAARDRAKSLGCPGLDRPGARGGAACSLYATEDTGARRGGKRGFSSLGPGSIRARARPAPRRACRLGGPAAPRPVCWCGETGGARPARCAGGVGEDRDADTRAPQGRDRGGGYGYSAA
jgi:hypothetical protein